MTHSNLPDALEEITAPLSAQVKLGLFGLLALLLLVAGLSIWSCHGQHQVAAHVQQADTHHGAALDAAAIGRANDAQAETQIPVIQADASEVARLRREVARLRGDARVDGLVGPVLPDAVNPPVAPSVDLAPLVSSQDLLIAALDRQVADQAVQIDTLTRARDSWRLSAQQSAAEAVQLRAALAAQQGLTQGALWRGRVQGFLVGAGGGYLGGRMR